MWWEEDSTLIVWQAAATASTGRHVMNVSADLKVFKTIWPRVQDATSPIDAYMGFGTLEPVRIPARLGHTQINSSVSVSAATIPARAAPIWIAAWLAETSSFLRTIAYVLRAAIQTSILMDLTVWPVLRLAKPAQIVHTALHAPKDYWKIQTTSVLEAVGWLSMLLQIILAKNVLVIARIAVMVWVVKCASRDIYSFRRAVLQLVQLGFTSRILYVRNALTTVLLAKTIHLSVLHANLVSSLIKESALTPVQLASTNVMTPVITAIRLVIPALAQEQTLV